MSGKYNKKHPLRGRSRYPQRLQARGLGKSPMLAPIDGDSGLRARQERRQAQTGSPFPKSQERDAA